LKPENVSTKQERIAELARNNPAMAFTSLNQYLDYTWVRYAYECTRNDGAVDTMIVASRLQSNP
jgi:RNA-directed DNA polymerase